MKKKNNHDEGTLHFLALHMTRDITSKTKRKLLVYYQNVRTLFSMDQKDLESQFVHEKGIKKFFFRRQESLDKASIEIQRSEKLGIRVLSYCSEDYPKGLLLIDEYPICIYILGSLEQRDLNAIAVVGSRVAQKESYQRAYQIAFDLASAGIVIVSGLAKGVDSFAHEGALAIPGGRTIAVLACGLNRIYPKENEALYHKIAKHGCVISEYPLDDPPRGYHFPFRNRLIAGLSYGVVFVEGSKKSGALYTTEYAFCYGREVYSYPGNPEQSNYYGNHYLIKRGATLIENSIDLMHELISIFEFDSINVLQNLKDRKQKVTQAFLDYIKNNQVEKLSDEQCLQISVFDEKRPTFNLNSNRSKRIKSTNNANEQVNKQEPNLDKSENDEKKVKLNYQKPAINRQHTEEEMVLLNTLSIEKGKSLDEIVEQTNLPVDKVISTLTMLLLEDECIQQGNYFNKV